MASGSKEWHSCPAEGLSVYPDPGFSQPHVPSASRRSFKVILVGKDATLWWSLCSGIDPEDVQPLEKKNMCCVVFFSCLVLFTCCLFLLGVFAICLRYFCVFLKCYLVIFRSFWLNPRLFVLLGLFGDGWRDNIATYFKNKLCLGPQVAWSNVFHYSDSLWQRVNGFHQENLKKTSTGDPQDHQKPYLTTSGFVWG